MSLPVVSGYVWESFGFRWVFLLAGAIALVGFFVCLQVRVPTAMEREGGLAATDAH
jgi:MFS family permease